MEFDAQITQENNKLLNKLINKLIVVNVNDVNFKTQELQEIIYLYKYVNIKYLLKKINRHKLNFYFFNNHLVKKYLPDLYHNLKSDIKNDVKDILRLTFLTIECSQIFNKFKLRHIFLKGIILAKQTTNSKQGRGKSLDLDIFINYKDISKTVNILQEIGFKVPPQNSLYLSKGLYGYIVRFLSQEMSMYRDKGNYREFIDIHWRLSSITNQLDSFDKLYSRHKKIFIEGYALNSLSINDTFIHICTHSAVDKWMSYRNLLDISNLANKIKHKNINHIRKNKLVRWSCYAAYRTTKNKKLIPFMSENIISKYMISRISNKYQNLPWRSKGVGGWTILNRMEYLFIGLTLSNKLFDWARFLVECFVRPSDMYDIKLRRERNLFEIIHQRYTKLKERLINNREKKPI